MRPDCLSRVGVGLLHNGWFAVGWRARHDTPVLHVAWVVSGHLVCGQRWRVAGEGAVGTRRVFATGMSNGGMISYRLAYEASAQFRAVDAVAGTNGQPGRPMLERRGVVSEVRSGCQDGAEVRLCVTDTGGHTWPGGRKSLGGKGSNALVATQELWAFFARQ